MCKIHSRSWFPKVSPHYSINSKSRILPSKLAPDLGELPRYCSLSAVPPNLWTCETEETSYLLATHQRTVLRQALDNPCIYSCIKRGGVGSTAESLIHSYLKYSQYWSFFVVSESMGIILHGSRLYLWTLAFAFWVLLLQENKNVFAAEYFPQPAACQ